MKTNPLVKTLGILAIATLAAGTAFADPGASHALYGLDNMIPTGGVGIGLYRTDVIVLAPDTEYTFLPNANTHGPMAFTRLDGGLQ